MIRRSMKLLSFLVALPISAQQSGRPPVAAPPVSPAIPAEPAPMARPAPPAAPAPAQAPAPAARRVPDVLSVDGVGTPMPLLGPNAQSLYSTSHFESMTENAFSQRLAQNFTYSTSDYGPAFRTFAPQSWNEQDPADSLYRTAREALNRGDYRRATTLFRDLPVKFPGSSYALDAYYYQALSLYYIGGTTELQDALNALNALEAARNKFPRSSRTQSDARTLTTRIAGVLSARGLGGSDIVKKALVNNPGTGCDTEDQSVRSEALNALMQTEPEAALQMAKRILAKRDECSVQLRKSAVWLLGNKRDATATTTLIATAKSDPAVEVRSEAISSLARLPGDDALATLEELARTAHTEPLQRAAVRALTGHSNPKARLGVRSLVEKNDAPESLRLTALDAFDRERSTCDDVSWMRTTYGKVTSNRIRARLASAIGRIGCEGTDTWLAQLAKNEDEPIEVRLSALRQATAQMDIAGISKLYDATAQGQIREELINKLGDRKEPEATDKLIDILKTGTNPQFRRAAINALTRKKDPRTTKLLMDLIDREKP